MTIKKKQTLAPKKSDKKKKDASISKESSGKSKQTIRKKMNEFGEDDSL